MQKQDLAVPSHQDCEWMPGTATDELLFVLIVFSGNTLLVTFGSLIRNVLTGA